MRLARWLVAPVLLALLAACGSTGSPAPTPTPPPNNGGGGTTPPPLPPVTYPNVQGIWYDSQASSYFCGTSGKVSVTANLNQQDYKITGTIQLQNPTTGTKGIFDITVGIIDTNGRLSGYSDSTPPATLFFDLTYGNGYLNGKLYTIVGVITCSNGTRSPLRIDVSLRK